MLQVWMPTGDRAREHRAHGAGARLPRGALQTLLVQGCCWALQQCCGLALGSGHRAGGKGTASSQQPQFLLCGFTTLCKRPQEPSEVWGTWGAPPASPLKVPHANDVHHFCQHLCGGPAWGWGPLASQHWAPHSLWEVLALHTSDQDRQGTQDDVLCLGAPSRCMGWVQGLPKHWPQQQLAMLEGQTFPRRRGGTAARRAVPGLPHPHSCNCGACSFCISNGETQMVTAECKMHLLKSAADCSS